MPTLSRRQFLASTVATAVGGLIPRKLLAYSPHRDTRIVIVTDDNATSGSTVNADVVRQMVNAGVKQLTQKPTVGEAWFSLFPGLASSSKISLKMNLSWSPNGNIIVHPVTADAIISGLQAMPVNGGAPPLEQILIWDLDKDPIIAAGYTINWGGPGVQCYYAVEDWWIFVNGGGIGDGLGFDPAYTCTIQHPAPYPDTDHHPTTIITQHSDYLINVGILGYHAEATITGVLKTHYGSYDGVRYPLYPNGYAMHGTGLSRGIPSFSAFIRDSLGNKQRLFMIDGLFGACAQGPQQPPDCVPNALIFGTDPVAVDYQMTQVLNQHRAAIPPPNGPLPPLDPPHVAASAGPPYNLGTNDPSEMDVIEIKNPSIPPSAVENVSINRIGDDIHVSWDAVPGVSNYNVYQLNAPYSSEPGTKIGSTVNASFIHVNGATQDSGFYRITAEY